MNFWLFLEINKYGDFYEFSDVRPPFTYAALIRQVFCHSLRYFFVILYTDCRVMPSSLSKPYIMGPAEC